MKPRVFVGSAAEDLDPAYAVQQNLEYDAEVTVWPQGILQLSDYTLGSLLNALDDFDFGIFVFMPDDITKMRSKESYTVRDNVLFELGLFVGRLGSKRSFIVMPRGIEDFRLPSDLLGLTAGTFDSKRTDNNYQAALGPVCNQIRKAIRSLGFLGKQQQERNEPLLAFHETFRDVNWNALLARAESQIDIVVYYFDSWVNAYYEAIVAYFRKPGSKMRVFVADPDDESILQNIQRLFPEYSPQVIKEKVVRTGERFAKAAKEAGATPERFEFYYVPHVLNYAAQCIDGKLLILSVFEMYRDLKIDSPAVILDLEKSERLKKYWDKEAAGLFKASRKIQAPDNTP